MDFNSVHVYASADYILTFIKKRKRKKKGLKSFVKLDMEACSVGGAAWDALGSPSDAPAPVQAKIRERNECVRQRQIRYVRSPGQSPSAPISLTV